MTKLEAEDRMLASLMTELFLQRYPDLKHESVQSYTEASLNTLNHALWTLLYVREAGAIGKFYTKFEARAV